MTTGGEPRFLEFNTDRVTTAAALFELANAEEAQSKEEHCSFFRDAINDILHRHPDMNAELIAFAAGIAVGRYQARRLCGCVADSGSE
jgi:hypothetical protein